MGIARALPLALMAVIMTLLETHDASAFCGFFVSGADAKLTNKASMVVMMRSGTKTVLAMQNDYSGPPESFALVIPVPVVLSKDNVRTLKKDLFERVDTLTSPRLVEYWEQDPCPDEEEVEEDLREGGTGTRAKGEEGSMGKAFGSRVTIEAKFSVAEYEIVILSAKDSAGLDGWLREQQYRIPEGAEEALRPYVAAGSKFFVAKVDVDKVEMVNGSARLSPLRFHYDSESFTLPVRLGLLASAGTQDVVVHVLARERYELASHPNATIPTNLEVDDAVRAAFPQFYAALFDRTLAQNPRAVITEYSWASASCDPCPVEPLREREVKALGGDVMGDKLDAGTLVLTRLHARYTKDSLGDDLVFRTAPPIEGGRESFGSGSGVRPASENTFQSRYIIRHPWKGAMRCADPERGVWGPPPPMDRRRSAPAATDLGATARDERTGAAALALYLRSDVDALGIKATRPPIAGERGLLPLHAFGLGALAGLGLAMALVVIGRRRDH